MNSFRPVKLTLTSHPLVRNCRGLLFVSEGTMMEAPATSSSFFMKFLLPLMSGGIAGTTVDVVLFPLDTIKTRLQSRKGFWAAGGFHRIYAGIVPAAAGSAPAAATFFCTYELTKVLLGSQVPQEYASFVYMLAATAGEVVSCVVRVPFEVIKQRSQANRHLKPSEILRHTLQTEGLRGLYRGYLSTVSREVPFSFIQYPLWEFFKSTWSSFQGSPAVEPWQSAVCGALAGGTAAALTTPLDVAKTRIMLAQAGATEVKLSIPQLLVSIGRKEGIRGLFAGFVPRVCWISLGGFVFLGAYEKSRHVLLSLATK